jgi:aminoglycoside 6'-N-acetyltransferase I
MPQQNVETQRAMYIERASRTVLSSWMRLRNELWPEESADESRAAVEDMLAKPERFVAFVATDSSGELTGFAEAALRSDYVNGCTTSPVGFLEGLYVVPERRRQGVARALVSAVEAWVREHGCSELASDALVDNADSHDLHRAVGFNETERVVYFRKTL